MNARTKYVAGTLAALLIAASAAQADTPKKAAAPAKSAPKPAAKPGGAKAPGAGGAAHGPTTTGGKSGSGITTGGRGATTTGGRGATTTGGRGATTTGGRTTTTAGGRPTATPGARAGASPASRTTPHGANGAAPKGSTIRNTPKGDQVRMRPGGRPGDVHVAGRNMDIHHGLAGGRSSRVERADHSRVVAERGRRGYVQHPYMYHGHEYGHRTYWAHGRAYDRYYARYPYHGVYVEMYSPVAYYPPAFYGWAYNPWVAPIAYPVAAWGWAAAPWYGVYGAAWFTPYPVYASASLWLTDYMISTTLAAQYQAAADAAAQGAPQGDAGAPAQAAVAPDAAPLTPDVKNLIAQEVQRQIAVENAEAAPAQQTAGPNPEISGVQRLLSDNQSHVFVAGASLDVVDANNNECAISDGDVLQLTPTPLPDDATAATLVVMTSKGGVECKKGAAVSVNIEDLQDMQNHMREAIDQGMGDLKTKQGRNGLPALPPSAAAAPVQAQFAMNAPPPDATAQQQITQQAQDADKAEQEVLAQAGSAPTDAAAPAAAPAEAPAAAPVEISLGLTVDQVTAALGQPKNIVDLGAKKIYVFKDMKITFKDGKVSDVQ